MRHLTRFVRLCETSRDRVGSGRERIDMLLRPSGVLGSGSRPARACPGAFPVSQRPFRQGVRLAVDVGSVRVGVARSDPGGVLATPLTVLASGPAAKAALARAELARLAASEGAIEVVVGLPTSLSGREGVAAAGARGFAADLAGRLPPAPGPPGEAGGT